MKFKTETNEFSVTKTGLWVYEDGQKKRKLCDPIRPTKLGRDPSRNLWFIHIRFRDRLGKNREFWVPLDKISRRGFLISELQGRGLKFSTSVSHNVFIDYIDSPELREIVDLCQKTGWVGNNQFLRGRHYVGEAKNRAVLSPDISDYVSPIRAQGSLRNWQNEVGARCRLSSLLMASVCMAFSAPLCEIADVEGGGIHIYGPTSIGKTTCLRVAASVVGNPSDYVETWHTTTTAIEQTAVARNSLLLCLDELTQASSNSSETAQMAKDISYLFGNGKPKRRDRGYEAINGGRLPSFNVSVLSSGEHSLHATAAASRSSRMGGEEIRIIDVKAGQKKGHGIFDYMPENAEGPERLSETITEAGQKYYGTPFKVFMDRLITTMKPAARRQQIRNHMSTFLEEAKANKRLVFQHRFAKRFAIIYAAGILAVELEVLDWPQDEIYNAVMQIYETACLDRQSTHKAQVKQLVELVRRNIRNGTDLADFSDEGHCDTNETEFKDHEGLRLLDAQGSVVAYKIRGKLLKRWCGSRRLAEIAIDWFVAKGYLDDKPNRYQGEQDDPRKVGNTKNRYRYFNFAPRVNSPRKLQR